jgi:A/G-specific adenine glycosylase
LAHNALASASPGDVVARAVASAIRAERASAAAAAMVERHDGEVPRTEAELLTFPVWAPTPLPLSRPLRIPCTVVVDTNVRRVLARVEGRAQACRR